MRSLAVLAVGIRALQALLVRLAASQIGLVEEMVSGFLEQSALHYSVCCVAVVCMIFTTPGKWDSNAKAVLNTWAKRCPIPLFFYSRSAASPGHPIINAKHAVALDVPEGRGHLTAKTMAALRYSLKTFGDRADWFMKCDDDL